MGNIIEVNNLSYAYNKGKSNEILAINNCSFSIEQNDFVGIIGESGSGKSTLVKILGGLISPQSGKYYFDGINMTAASQNKLARLRNSSIGIILQSYGLLDDRSAYENVCLPLLFSKYSYRDIEKRVIEVLSDLDIADLQNRKPSSLSGGQNQRVAIARALVHSPKLILADEPTGALDSDNTLMIMKLLKTINEKGTTIVLITHNNKILDFCNRIYIMSDGTIKEVLNEKNVLTV